MICVDNYEGSGAGLFASYRYGDVNTEHIYCTTNKLRQARDYLSTNALQN